MNLAINGGSRAIAAGSLQASPPTLAIDEEYVLKSLRSGAHAWGENCEKLQSEWAAWNGNKYCAGWRRRFPRPFSRLDAGA